MTPTCVTTTSATTPRSLLPTRPETGRGQASLWTAAAAPDHRLWTTLRGPVDPSRLPTCPLPLRRGRPPTTHQSHQSKERRLTPSAKSPNRHWRTSTGPNRWAIPEHRSGPYRLVKSTRLPKEDPLLAPRVAEADQLVFLAAQRVERVRYTESLR